MTEGLQITSPEASLRYEAELIAEFRPACPGCGSVHPLSRTPPVLSGVCPCGHAAGAVTIHRQATPGWPGAEAAQ